MSRVCIAMHRTITSSSTHIADRHMQDACAALLPFSLIFLR